MWGFHVLWPVVIVGEAKQLGQGPYHGKRVAAHRPRSGSMGQQLARLYGTVSL